MPFTIEMVTFDCTDPDALAGWWAHALGGELSAVAPGEFAIVVRPDGPRLGFQRVDEPTPGKNRVHVDFVVTDVDAEVARLVAAGATDTGRHDMGNGFRWVVLNDPEGNVFCVAHH